MAERPTEQNKSRTQRAKDLFRNSGLAVAIGFGITACGNYPDEPLLPQPTEEPSETPTATQRPTTATAPATSTTQPTPVATIFLPGKKATATPKQPGPEPTLANRPVNLLDRDACWDSHGIRRPLSNGSHEIWNDGWHEWICDSARRGRSEVIFNFRDLTTNNPAERFMWVAWDVDRPDRPDRYGYGFANPNGQLNADSRTIYDRDSK